MTPSLQPQSALPADLAQAYQQCVSEGKLKDDDAQRQVIAHFQALSNGLNTANAPGLLAKIWGRKPSAPKSIYLWGAVGRGKSLLMDMFYASAKVSKKRIHFLGFMQEVHAVMHEKRQAIEAGTLQAELISAVADVIAKRYGQLLCLDEFEVADVADALILARLFTALMERNMTFVFTSNRPPEELYIGGLQRDQFMAFVKLVYARMEVLQLTSPHDYRMQQIRAMRAVYMWPLTPEAEQSMRESFLQLTHHDDPHSVVLDVQGRALPIEISYGGMAAFSFAELCEKPLGAADYLAIARRFHTVFLSNIPTLGQEKRNEAKRFVTLIDTLYDHKVKLICTAAAPPNALYTAGDGIFEFQRTISRLAEMQSQSYLSSPHIP